MSMPGSYTNKPTTRTSSESDSDSDSSSVFDSAPSSPTSSTALKEEHKLRKASSPKNSAVAAKTENNNTIRPSRPTSQYVTPPLPLEAPNGLGRASSLVKSSLKSHLRKKTDTQRRYSTTLADLRLPPSKMTAQKENIRLDTRERTLSSRKPSSLLSLVPRTANWQIPPHIHAQRKMHLTLNSPPSRQGSVRRLAKDSGLDPANVLKLKISCRESLEEIVALKLRKDRLRSLMELVDVILFKLAGKLPCAKEGVKISLVFPDSSLPSVTLKSPGGCDDPYNCECEDFMMGYIQAKSKIYVKVSS